MIVKSSRTFVSSSTPQPRPYSPDTLFYPGNNLYRNWTSLELAKPVWGEEAEAGRGAGTVELVDMDTVDTYGFWDQSLDLLPAMSR